MPPKAKKRGSKKKAPKVKPPIQEVIYRFEKHKYEKEIKIQSKSNTIIESKWRELILNQRAAQYLQDISFYADVFRDMIEIKNTYIREFRKLLDDYEIQHRIGLSSSAETIMILLKNYNDALNSEGMKYELSYKALLNSRNDELKDIDRSFKENEEKFDIMEMQMAEDFELWFCSKSALSKYMLDQKEENFRSNMAAMEGTRVNGARMMWKKFDLTMEKELKKSMMKLKDLQEVHEKHLKTWNTIEEQRSQIKKTHTILRELRALEKKCANTKSVSMVAPRLRINDDSKIQEDRFYYMIVCSGEAMKHLAGVVKKADKIFLLAKMCSCLETEYERTFLYDFISKYQDLDYAIPELKKLFAKSGQVELEKLSLLNEKKALLVENEELKNEIKRRLTTNKSFYWSMINNRAATAKR